MPGFGNVSPESAVTPYRKTVVAWDGRDTCSIRPPWALTRRGPAIARSQSAQTGQVSSGVTLLPSGVWQLQSHQQRGAFERQETQDGVIRSTDYNLGAGMREVPFWRRIAELGITWNAAVIASGAHFLVKEVAAGGSYDNHLGADAGAFPSPTNLPSANAPMDRVASGKVTYPANQAFMVRFQAPGTAAQVGDTIATIFFGGQTAAAKRDGTPVHDAGNFALNLFTDGKAWLQEKIDGAWKVVHDFRWAQPHDVPGKFHNLLIAPQATPKKQISIVAAHSDAGQSPGSMIAAPAIASRAIQLATVYTHSQHVTGYAHKKDVTGAGHIRIDQRRDYSVPVQVSVLTFPTTGTLVDAPLICPFPLRDGDPIKFNMFAVAPPGTNVTAQGYRADNGDPLAPNPDDTFQAVAAAQGAYFFVFTFTSTGTATPTLISYEVSTEGRSLSDPGDELIGGNVRRLSITGPDLVPDHDTAQLSISDPKDALQRLRNRARTRVEIRDFYATNTDPTKYCILFRGEVADPDVERRGVTRNEGMAARAGAGSGGIPAPKLRQYPSAQWRNLEVANVGRWARIADQLSFTLKDFNRPPYPDWSPDVGLGTDPYGGYYPWRITDILKWCYTEAGVSLSDLDIPDLPVRAYTSGKDTSEYLLQATASIADFLNTMARQYLGGYLLYEPNAGPNGMWRFIEPPLGPPYTSLFTFRTWGPASAPNTFDLSSPKMAHTLISYPAGTSYIKHYRSRPKALEGNIVIVTATGELLPDQQGANVYLAVLANPASFSIDGVTPVDRNHPDYLGYVVPITDYDHALGVADPLGSPQDSVNFVCKRIYNQAAHTQKWCHFEGPLVLVQDLADEKLQAGTGIRPLRPYDVITVQTSPTQTAQWFVRSVQVAYKSDRNQRMEVEALAVDNTTPSPS